MNLQQTSLEAYISIRPSIGYRQEQVLEALMVMKEATNAMLARKLNLPINCITPRTNELVKKGMVEESYKDICPVTKSKATFWRCRNG